jgi:hypothetical protein
VFDFILKKKRKDNRLNLYFSDNMISFFKKYINLTKVNELINYTDKKNICYVDISPKNGFVYIYQSSNYLNKLKKFKLNEKDYNFYKDNVNQFIKDYNYKLDNKYQLMKFGKLINKLITISPYDVESYTIRYKYYQHDFYTDLNQ